VNNVGLRYAGRFMRVSLDAPHCLLFRDGKVTVGSGPVRRHRLLEDLPAPSIDSPLVVSMVPYCQVRERGFLVHDGQEEILSLVPNAVSEIELDALAGFSDDVPIRMNGPVVAESTDEQFASRVAAVIRNEICAGEGSNFLISRKHGVKLESFDASVAHTIFRRLARSEFGAYLTFCFFDGRSYFIGSSPERHITIRDGFVQMNPISGTLPKRDLASRADLIAFLSDPKEINELFQVVDEELKMMSKICSDGGEIRGPFLKEMSTLIHTEYELDGHSKMPIVDAFRLSMFAATMIGSPLENAARIIHKYEAGSRRYYTGAIVLRSCDPQGKESLDSAITIRTMEVDLSGRATIQAGASIVRDSVPEKECLEVKAKAAGLLRAIESGEAREPELHRYVDEHVQEILRSRNKYLSRFWINDQQSRFTAARSQRSLLIVDNEDEFTFMLRHMLEHLGIRATIRNFDDPAIALSATDLVLVGPGPGDPTDTTDPKMAVVHGIVDELLRSGRKFLAVCLGHQILCHRLGMSVVRVDPPLQGVQQTIDLFGRTEACGFYNTFFATAPTEPPVGLEFGVEPGGRVIALRSAQFVSFQFHVESVLTTNGMNILRDALEWLSR
jgi:phenazine biosynthesis protein phzE